MDQGYEFGTMLTNLDSRYMMKGIWIFETEANSDMDTIDFEATWVNNDEPPGNKRCSQCDKQHHL